MREPHGEPFPDSSVGKESACKAGDPGSIPGLGRSVGEGIGYPLQHSWASLVAQLVKNPPAMRETWVQSLDTPNAGIEPASLVSPVVAGRFFTPAPCGKLTVIITYVLHKDDTQIRDVFLIWGLPLWLSW